MSLNIKNPEAHRLARELATLTGESMTEAVTEAVRERLTRVKREKSADRIFERLMAIAEETGPRFKGPWTSTNMGDMLYDENGLPRSGEPLYDEERRPY